MHGLRCGPDIAGWTRLLDEWVVGLNLDAGQPVFTEEALFLRSVAQAATRVRAFAWDAEEMPQVTPDAEGHLRFDLQGVPYWVVTRFVRVADPAALAHAADGWLDEAATSAARSAEADEADDGVRGVGLVMVCVDPPGDRNAYREVVRGVQSTASAWSFPTPELGSGYDYAGTALGGVLLARAAE